MDIIKNILSEFEFYRKFIGGKWYYNRRINDLGRSLVFTWDRYSFGYNGGFRCTYKEIDYGNKCK